MMFDSSREDAIEAAECEERAREHFSADRLAPAIFEIDRAVECDPNSFDAWSMRAKILIGAGRSTDALVSIDRALAIVPDDYDALAEKSGILSMFVGDIEGGLAYAERAYAAMRETVPPEQRADRDGDDFYAVESVYENLYYALYRSGDRERAETIRTEAASSGHLFEEGIDADE